MANYSPDLDPDADPADSWDTWTDPDAAWTTTEQLAEDLDRAAVRLDRAIRRGSDPVQLRQLAAEVRGLARAVLVATTGTASVGGTA